MPAGVSWGKYLTFFVAAFASMAAGAQTVHKIYSPLEDLDKYVEKELEKRHLPLKAKDILTEPATTNPVVNPT